METSKEQWNTLKNNIMKNQDDYTAYYYQGFKMCAFTYTYKKL